LSGRLKTKRNNPTSEMINALTIDVEDGWSIFSRDLLAKEIEPTDTVVRDTQWILGILEQKNIKATFFVLGDAAKTFPSLIKQIAQSNHEIGVHGFSHKQLFKLTREEFHNEISYVKNLLEDIGSVQVRGYRAPAFSIMPLTGWAFEVLSEVGFAYDSSVMPCRNKRYGWPGFSRDICNIELPSGKNIIEVPMSVLGIPILGKGFGTGGGYLRHFPYILTKRVIKYIQQQRPVVVYMHPYEFGTEVVPLPANHLRWQDKMNVALRLKIAMRNKKSMPGKLKKLLSDFEFTSIENIIKKQAQQMPTYHLAEFVIDKNKRQ